MSFIGMVRVLPVLLLAMKTDRARKFTFPLEPENLTAPHARVKSDRNHRADVFSSSSEMRKQSLLFVSHKNEAIELRWHVD